MSDLATLTRRAVLGGGIAMLLALPGAAQQIDINGIYLAEGRNPDGSAYSGQAVLAEANGAVQINWTVGNSSYAGVGRREGQIVVIDWGQAEPVIYVVMSNGNLHGTWANGTALERLVRQ